jgi:2-oxopent-4-enoate/cis-2-oxohex-4-enoate hydratase
VTTAATEMPSEQLALTRAEQRGLAEELLDAAHDRRAVEPLSERHRQLTVADASRIRDMVLACRLAAGERLIGATVSLGPLPPAGQRNRAEPRLGWLTDAMLLSNGIVEPEHHIAPRVEAKLAFMVSRSLRRPIATVSDLLASTYRVYPCLEVIDSRYGRARLAAADEIADNCGAGRLMLGRGVPPPAEGHLRRAHLRFEVDGAAAERGRAALDFPPEATLWLGNQWIATAGELLPGTLLTAAAAAPAVPLAPRVRVAASFRGIGRVELRVAVAKARRQTAVGFAAAFRSHPWNFE